MTVYNIEFALGQALVEASSEEEAETYAREEWGSYNGPYQVSEASKSDIVWVTGMGGVVHHVQDDRP